MELVYPLIESFCIISFDLCDDIAQLDTFLMSIPAPKTPTYVGSSGEEADTAGSSIINFEQRILLY